MSLGQFDSLLNGNYPTLEEALSIIKEYKIRCCGYKKEQVFIYVGIDEFTKYSEVARNEFKLMFNNVGSTMCDSPKGVFFQPFFTGVDYRNVEIITKSMHTHVYLTPSLLRYKSMASIVDSMAEKYACLKSWRVSRHFKRMMADVGGHPRSFEYLIDICLGECKRTNNDIASAVNASANILWNNVVKQVERKYTFPNMSYEALENCMIDCFLETQTPMTPPLQDLYKSGLISIARVSALFSVTALGSLCFT